MPKAILAGHTIDDVYQLATRSVQELFSTYLPAAAESAGFSAGWSRNPLKLIAGRRLDIPAFSHHVDNCLSRSGELS